MQPRTRTIGGYEWQSAEQVSKYLNREKEPEREADVRGAHQRMVALLPVAHDAVFEFMDLGAGAGAVSASVMRAFPNARAILADMSAPMMQAGGEQLQPFEGRYRYVELDMNADIWPAELGGPFQAVVSARAIHHLTNERKLNVFKHAFDALAPGGVFVNWDMYRDLAKEKADPSNEHNRTAGSMDEQMVLLREAGFQDVTCRLEERRRAIFFGKKS
ncbi:MAG TPA: class I SAM-dependent methyltransferase [Chloroflexota bacterium]|nr:class I SAM-dependent methyltransferase [Chloroflexota bacterium]